MEVKEIILASERNFNLATSIIKNAPNKKLEFPVTTTFKKGMRKVSYSYYWDELCFQILDFVMTKGLREFYIDINGGTIPQKPYEQCTKDNTIIYPRYDEKGKVIPEIIDEITVKKFQYKTVISEREFRTYKQFKKISPQKLRDTLKLINHCKFNIPYPIRVLTGEKFISKEIQIENQSVCNITIINEKISNTNRILDRKYLFSFDSLLGNLMMYNICMICIDWIPLKFYDLKYKTQLFYRKIVGPYNSKKLTATYYFSDLNANLNFGNINVTFTNEIIKCVIELLKYDLIAGYKIQGNLIRIDFKKKSEIIENVNI